MDDITNLLIDIVNVGEQLETLLRQFPKASKIQGQTAYRAIAGEGPVHSSLDQFEIMINGKTYRPDVFEVDKSFPVYESDEEVRKMQALKVDVPSGPYGFRDN